MKGKTIDPSDSEDERESDNDFASKMDDDDDEDDDDDMYKHFSIQNKGSHGQRSHFDDRQTDKQDNGTSNFFEDSSDDDHIDLPDITDGNNDLDLEKFNEEFGMTGWAEKKKKAAEA